MKKALTPALLLVLGSVVLGATVFREQIARAAPGIQDVFVTNSTREPVPVHEQGTADVNVTNAPLAVHEQGTASVNVTNAPLAVHEQGTANVNVTNAPLAVRASGEQPVQRGLEWDFSASCSSDGNVATYPVPAGKYLRIEQVNFPQFGTDHIYFFSVDTLLPGAGSLTRHYLEHTRTGVSQLVRIYAGPGSNAVFRLRFDACTGGTWRGSFSGVLIDAP